MKKGVMIVSRCCIFVFLISIITIAGSGISAFGQSDWTGNVNFFLGAKALEEDEWEPIGKLLVEYDLMGGDIVNIASEAEQKYRRIASRLGDDAFNLSATEVENKVGGVISQGDLSEYITTGADIIQSIMKQAEKAKNVRKSYLGGRQEDVFALAKTG